MLYIIKENTAAEKIGARIPPTRPEVEQSPSAAVLVLVGKSSTV